MPYMSRATDSAVEASTAGELGLTRLMFFPVRNCRGVNSEILNGLDRCSCRWHCPSTIAVPLGPSTLNVRTTVVWSFTVLVLPPARESLSVMGVPSRPARGRVLDQSRMPPGKPRDSLMMPGPSWNPNPAQRCHGGNDNGEDKASATADENPFRVAARRRCRRRR